MKKISKRAWMALALAAALSLGFYFTGDWRKRVGSIDK